MSLCDVEYRKLDFAFYPPHVKTLKNYAFKPLIIAVCILIINTHNRNISALLNSNIWKTILYSNSHVMLHKFYFKL